MKDYKKELEELILTLIRDGASDLHLAVGHKPIIRLAGELITLVKYELLTKEDIFGVLSELLKEKTKIDSFLENQDIDFSYDFRGEARLRGSAFFQKGNIGIALRLIPKSIKTFAELKLPSILEVFARKKQGFFLVVGPVGQGKSTTLASMIEFINQERAEHIVTIENPVEFIFEPKRSIIDQREVGVDTKSFASGLKSAFRQDVDVVMIGEMRDQETISIAVTAAETGHLVLSTLHTNTASQTIDRIIDSFPSSAQDQIRIQLASSLLGIFSQRLIPSVTGGLVPAYELLINNNAVANLIREKRTHEIDVIIETGSENGMIDLNRSLVNLVRNGEITIENAYANSNNPKVLERLI